MRLFVIFLTLLALHPMLSDAHRAYSYSRTYSVQEEIGRAHV